MLRRVNADELLRELAIRADQAGRRGDHAAKENHAAAWHSVNAERQNLSTRGLSKRLAAKQAAIPLDQRTAQKIR